jgi:glycosyltransferase involved in cell wall biosynthesis
MQDPSPLKILHVLRAPVGGLFRHVLDLTKAQVARGHKVGVITDNLTGGERAERILAELAPSLALGLTRTAMPRNPSLHDFSALAHVRSRIMATQPDVVHGHGSKGGVYARCATWISRLRPVVSYTPHGGSFNYKPGSTPHKIYMAIEGALRPLTHLYTFESAYIAQRMREDVGPTRALTKVVWNGISSAELTPVAPREGAADFLYIGELRSVKGIDTLLDALAKIHARTVLRPRLILVGSGPDEAMLKQRVVDLGLDEFVNFAGTMNARDAFAQGRVMVVPSRAESLPYVVLEAAGAHVPLVATNAGGIPEIFGPYAHRCFDYGDADLLAERMSAALEASSAQCAAETDSLFQHVRDHFSLDGMTDAVIAAYREAMTSRAPLSLTQFQTPTSGVTPISPKV